LSLVRSLPDYRIEPKPTLGWCKQNLGFITDEHQTNVALTRARKGLIVVGELINSIYIYEDSIRTIN
jgi:superfamily I DNA and/or RNA helicase